MGEPKHFELPTDSKILGKMLTKFWSHVDKQGPVPLHVLNLGCCWVWTGRRYNKEGYGGFYFSYFKGRTLAAHRVSWSISRGRFVPLGKRVLHRCDNSMCVRPSHLFLGTIRDNNADARLKGRCHWVGCAGEKNGQHKLTDEKVRIIRKIWLEGAVTNKELAERYGVSHSQISYVTSGKSWVHVT